MALQKVEKYDTEKPSKTPFKLPNNRPNHNYSNGSKQFKRAFKEKKSRSQKNTLFKQGINFKALRLNNLVWRS